MSQGWSHGWRQGPFVSLPAGWGRFFGKVAKATEAKGSEPEVALADVLTITYKSGRAGQTWYVVASYQCKQVHVRCCPWGYSDALHPRPGRVGHVSVLNILIACAASLTLSYILISILYDLDLSIMYLYISTTAPQQAQGIG